MPERALMGRKKADGSNDLSTLEAAHNLGKLYWKQGNNAEPESMLLRALERRGVELQASHTLLLKTLYLGNFNANQGKVDKTEEMYQRALEGIESALGRDHTATLHTINNLGLLYQKLGKLYNAKEMYKPALGGGGVQEGTRVRPHVDA
jgi:tetratricopeptide (TPR) repeat protein